MNTKNASQKKLFFMLGGLLVLVILVAVIFGSREDMNTGNLPNSQIAQNTNSEENKQEESSENIGTISPDTQDSETGTVTESETGTEEDTQKPEDTQDSNQGNTENNLPLPSVPAEFANLSNESKGWGPGGPVNELNQSQGCIYYNSLYNKYGAYFMVEDSNYVYLTMDEGYENGYTPKILDVLKEKNVKVVFFVTSQFVKSNPELVQRMIDEGHVVGNHSVTHPSKGMPSLSIEAQKNELMTLHNMIKDKFGYEMTLFRNPAGIFSEQSLAVTQSCGYKSIFWSFAYLDYDTANQPDPTTALNNMIAKVHPGAIYLLHAVSATNTEVLGDFIDQVRAKGFEFAVLK